MTEHHEMDKDTNSGKGSHPFQGWSDVVDEAARVALVQAIGNRGIVVYQTAGLRPGFYALNGVTGESTYLNEPTAAFESGWLSGLDASINADPTKFNLATGFYRIQGIVEPFELAALTAQTVPNLMTEEFSIIMVDANGDLLLTSAAPTDEQTRTHAVLQTLQHIGSVINVVDNTRHLSEHITAALHDQVRAFGPRNSGNTYEPAGSDLAVKKLPGSTRVMMIEAVNNINAPNRQTNAVQDPVAFPTFMAFQSIRDSFGEFTITPFTAVPVGFWDNNTGTLLATPKFVIYRFEFFNNGTIVVVGQATYDTLADGVAAALLVVPEMPPEIVAVPNTFRAAIVAEGDVTDLAAGVIAGKVQFIQVMP